MARSTRQEMMLEDGSLVGCDIHMQIEQRRDGRWEPIHPLVLSDDFVSEIAYEMTDKPGQAIDMVLPAPENEVIDPDETEADYKERLRERVSAWLYGHPFEEMWEKYRDDQRLQADFMDSFRKPSKWGKWKARCLIEERHYGWFGFLCEGVRAKFPFSFPERGLPEDVNPYTKHNSDRWDTDGHSHSWVMVSEILACKEGAKQFQDHYLWLTENIPYPDETRLVFWFDN